MAEEGGRGTIVHRNSDSCLRSARAASAHCQLEIVPMGMYTSFGTPADRSLLHGDSTTSCHAHATGSNSTGVLGVRPNSRVRVRVRPWLRCKEAWPSSQREVILYGDAHWQA